MISSMCDENNQSIGWVKSIKSQRFQHERTQSIDSSYLVLNWNPCPKHLCKSKTNDNLKL